jgi:ectoine hydroxylase-related dioxygenase (phytanoyl-CoA dioxygenase family)
MTLPRPTLTAAHAQSFRDEGYFVVDDAVPQDDLEALRAECQRLVAEREAEMDRLGVDVIDLDHRGRRYFVHGYDDSAVLRRFLASDLMVDVARAALGDTVYLFNEQFVVKGAELGMRFAWHQDSGFIDHPHRPYVTCWIPLDDVSESNGTVYVLPFSRAGGRDVVPHVREEGTNDLIGYTGDDPGIPLVVPAGTVVGFSSTLLHRTGPNSTDRQRRVYVTQYSSEPILAEDGEGPRHLAVPLLVDGIRHHGVADPSSDPRRHGG